MTIVPPSVASPDEATRQSRVLIADDHALVRDGLRRIIESEPGLCVCGHAVDGESTLQRLADTPCDVLLLDLTMPAPHGVDLIGRIRTRWPDLPILVLSMHNHIAIVQAVLQAGARGYIVKDSDPEVLLEALRTVVDGGSYLVPKLRHELAALEEAPRPLAGAGKNTPWPMNCATKRGRVGRETGRPHGCLAGSPVAGRRACVVQPGTPL